MARRKTSKAKTKAKHVNSSAEIERLLAERSAKRPKHNPVTETATVPELKSEFAAVLAKFAPRETETMTPIPSTREVVPRPRESTDKGRDKDIPTEDKVHKDKDKDKDNVTQDNVAQDKRAQDKRPTLAELKARSKHPSTVDHHDVNAAYPFLLTAIKAGPRTVPVPPHWQNRRGYLSGRSLLTKRPFVLPEPLQQTGIEEMRQTLGTDVSNEDTSLKSDARARVQPRTGTLDIDYARAYSAVFQAGRTYRPPLLLPLGDMYYENRGLDREAQWRTWRRKYTPGKFSKGLREAMRLDPGQLPPWCRGMSQGDTVELPPAYPGMLVAGVNWDISNLTEDKYAEVPHGAAGATGASPTTYFGEIVTFDKEVMPAGIIKKRENTDTGAETLSKDKLAKTMSKDKSAQTMSLDIPVTTVDAAPGTLPQHTTDDKSTHSDEDKPLYTVIDTAARIETAIPADGDSTDTDSEQELDTFRF